MECGNQVCRLKVDSSGRLCLPSDVRERNRIANGDTVIIVQDSFGLHIKTRDQLLADVRASLARHVPRNVSLAGAAVSAVNYSEVLKKTLSVMRRSGP